MLSPGGGGSGGGGADPGSAAAVGAGKPERPSSLAPGKLTRRLLCYHSDHCMSHNSPPRVSALVAAAATTGESLHVHSVAHTTLFAVARRQLRSLGISSANFGRILYCCNYCAWDVITAGQNTSLTLREMCKSRCSAVGIAIRLG